MIQLITRGLFEFSIIIDACELLRNYCCTKLIRMTFKWTRFNCPPAIHSARTAESF